MSWWNNITKHFKASPKVKLASPMVEPREWGKLKAKRDLYIKKSREVRDQHGCADSSKSTDSLKKAVCPTPKKGETPVSVTGICWPSVCESILDQSDAEKWDELFGPETTAVFLERTDVKGAFSLYAKEENIDAVFSQAGFNLIEPAPGE